MVALPPSDGKPPYPSNLRLEGKDLWDRAWSAAITWLSPDSDGRAVEFAARLADQLEVARKRYMATTDPSDARALVALSKQYLEALSALGFTPVARARLGVAEVKRVSQLEELQAKRKERG